MQLGKEGGCRWQVMCRIHVTRGALSLQRLVHMAAEMHGDTNSPVNSPMASGTWRWCHCTWGLS